MIKKNRTRIQIRNEKKILQAALEVFASHGYHGATGEKVAALADMSQPNLHHYFKTKADLYIAVLDQTIEIWIKPLGKLNPDGDPATELRRYIAQKVRMARQYSVASRVFANEMLQGAPVLGPHLRARLKDIVDEWTVVIRQWVAAGKLKDVNPYHLIFMIWGTTQHYSDFLPQVTAVMGLSRLTIRHFDAVEESICKIILDGILPPKAVGSGATPAQVNTRRLSRSQ
jgi:TetR/AcrR family transcriptional regulator